MTNIELKGFKGLKDLDSLVASSKAQTRTDQLLQYLDVGALQPGKYQPRKDFSDEQLSELTESILSHGVIQPLIVRRIDPGKYEIIAGERRWRAAISANLMEVPVVVRDVDDGVALAFALIENIQRQALNPIEEAMALRRLIEEFNMTHDEVAQSIGRSRASVSNELRLLNLSEPVQQFLIDKMIDVGHAKLLLTFDSNTQLELAKKIVSKKLTVRSTEILIQRAKESKGQKTNIYEQKVNRWVKMLSGKLSSKVTVKINESGEGRIVIPFSSPDEVDWLVELLLEDK